MMLGHGTNWDTLDQYVVTNLGVGDELPAEFVERYEHADSIAQGGFEFTVDNHRHHARFLPVDDKGKRNVGRMWLLIDVDNEISDSYQITVIASGVATFLGTILFVIFFQLVTRIESVLTKHQQALRYVATNDGLTGIYNRRSFDAIIESELRRAKRYKRELSLLIIDIDHFKAVNDNFGHMAGDTVLRELAKDLSRELRSNDYLARYGGEEFAIILPETPLNMAHLFAERVRTSAGARDYEIGGADPVHLTLSIGIASFPSQAETPEELIQHADVALYRAKEAGRNRVCDFDQDA